MKPSRLVLCALFLSACGTLVPSTAARLAAFSPLEANPSDIAVALILPQELRVREDGAKLELIAQRSDTGEEFKGAYTLAETPANAADFGADAAANARFYAIRPADADEMRKAQDKVKAWKAAGLSSKGSGSIGIGLDACTTGAAPAPDARVSAYIRTAPGAAFLPLIEKAQLIQLLGAELLAQLKPCDGPR